MKRKILQNIDVEKFQNSIYIFLIELDKFKHEAYHQIYYFTYMRKTKENQAFIARNLGMDQSTVSRKLKEINSYIILKIKEQK